MLTQQFRPKVFSEVAGQDLVKKALKAIIKNPDSAPKVLILQGAYGTGKTSLARIFARALNCKNKINGEPCGVCEVCKNIEDTIYYSEYDSALVGNVEAVKSLRDYFVNNTDSYWKVITIDEFHLVSVQAQSALLKIFEESTSKIFFILCTTNIENILKPLRSRALELNLTLIPDDIIKANLKEIIKVKNIDIEDNIIDLIVLRARGHLRDAHMLLDRYSLLDKEDFITSINSAREYFIKFLTSCLIHNKEKAARYIYLLQGFTLSDLKQDYESVILEILKVSLKVEEPKDDIIKALCNLIGYKTLDLYYILMQDIVFNSFTGDKLFQAACWYIYTQVNNFKN